MIDDTQVNTLIETLFIVNNLEYKQFLKLDLIHEGVDTNIIPYLQQYFI